MRWMKMKIEVAMSLFDMPPHVYGYGNGVSENVYSHIHHKHDDDKSSNQNNWQ